MVEQKPVWNNRFCRLIHPSGCRLLGCPDENLPSEYGTIRTTPTERHDLMELIEKWKTLDAVETYGIRHWGKGYFGINKDGHVTVHPNKRPEQSIDLKDLIDQLQTRGIQLPILIRFTDILRHRVGEIQEAFRTAISEHDYRGAYCCVYPIKVNQQRHVVEEILDFGRPFNFG